MKESNGRLFKIGRFLVNKTKELNINGDTVEDYSHKWYEVDGDNIYLFYVFSLELDSSIWLTSNFLFKALAKVDTDFIIKINKEVGSYEIKLWFSYEEIFGKRN